MAPEAPILVPTPADRTILILHLVIGNRSPATRNELLNQHCVKPAALSPLTLVHVFIACTAFTNDFVYSMVGHLSLVSPRRVGAPAAAA